MKITDQVKLLKQGNFKTLSRAISLVENEVPGYEDLLKALEPSSAKIIGITGAPGAGKSSLGGYIYWRNDTVPEKKLLSFVWTLLRHSTGAHYLATGYA